MEYKSDAELKAAVKRIKNMERDFDKAKTALSRFRKALEAYNNSLDSVKRLSDYYDGEWKRDFQADENGELLSDLKRGVLSEDGLWNFFEENTELADELQDLIERIAEMNE